MTLAPDFRARPSLPLAVLEDSTAVRPFDQAKAEEAIRDLLIAVGEDPDREGLLDTPARVARAYRELFAGLYEEPSEHLARTFEQESVDLVTLRDIEFTSFCEHHLLPVFGKAHVAYLPSQRRVVGLSKLARTVDVYAKRPQLQERFNAQIADALMDHLEPRGVLVVVEAEHMCMKMRGVHKQQPVMSTFAGRGVFAEPSAMRSEVFALLGAFPGQRPMAPTATIDATNVNDGEACACSRHA